MQKIEVRAFGDLKKLFEQRGWGFPLMVDQEGEISAADLAQKLDLPKEKIEIVFLNGKTQRLDCLINPGDRVAFVPPGTPGPYRVLLGFVQKENGGEK